MPTPRRTTPLAVEALAIYLELGDERTLSRVYAVLVERYGKEYVPEHQAIERWSARNKWVEEAQKYDRRTLSKVREKSAEKRAKIIVGAADRLRELVKLSLDEAIDALTQKHEKKRAKAKSAGDVSSLITAALACLKHIEVLEGRASDRVETNANVTVTQAPNIAASATTLATRIDSIVSGYLN